ncbi:hypothetical protein FVEN_g9618 [Fusarium venenatum]|uniref:Zn(2)-C6 fungal-type domain-containing protein n=1 Tax=Fusarium venenatum TaxID=56646 RepID=A0A2L2TCK5_9HYPO|nr:uncharacterized protein FVRRES_04330 [Fusarium venenatum]KAG8352520.1 hypothetical protein FVEN_g9618 [Fusarium venenatum]KAH7002726.1 hypothetical protein EDB82DRAFT_481901 [Fusarium venenatum]CEI67818.1 unnamed protein product [Fusarium venenatum]
MTSPISPVIQLSQRKACLTCAKAKRTCDKRTPICQRCAEKNLACQYPSTRRYYRVNPASASQDTLRSEWVALSTDITNKTGRQMDSNMMENHQVTPLAGRSPTVIPVSCGNWFLNVETWTIENVGATNCCINPSPTHMSICVKSWTTIVGGWLCQWVKEGCNPFIHQQLYSDTGLPQCLQDAWTTLTAYMSKTAQNEHITMQIVQDRANGLLQTQTPDDGSFMSVTSIPTLEHLVRVQALFIYQHIRLFDGSIRQRSLAEKEIQTLSTWCQQLWQSATLDASCEVGLLNHTGFNGAHDEECATNPGLWRAWILSESIRRTWLVCQSTMAAYLRERDGWNFSPGEIRFTACQGL